MTRTHWLLIAVVSAALLIAQSGPIMDALHDATHTDPPDEECYDPCMDTTAGDVTAADAFCAAECYGRVTWTTYYNTKGR
jgi:hypothetical protein